MIEYKVLCRSNHKELEQEMNHYAKEGWKLFSPVDTRVSSCPTSNPHAWSPEITVRHTATMYKE